MTQKVAFTIIIYILFLAIVLKQINKRGAIVMSFIEVKNLTFIYNPQESLKPALNNISLNLDKGEFIAILGANGCGKSTLCKHLNALILPTSGSVTVDNTDTSIEENKYKIRSLVGLVLQNPDNQIVSSIVKEDVAFGLENIGLEPNEIKERVNEALKAVGMYKYKDDSISNLSGGQKQRIAIAGILALKPKCIILDEPTSMLDPNGRREVLSTIKKLNDDGITVILITHLMKEALAADRVIIMEDGNIILDAPSKEALSNVSFLNEHSLAPTQTAELIYRLKKEGFDIQGYGLDVDDCVYLISKLLEEHICQ